MSFTNFSCQVGGKVWENQQPQTSIHYVYSCYLVSLHRFLPKLSRLHSFRGEACWKGGHLRYSPPPCLHPFRKSGLVMTSYVPGPGSSYRWNNFQGISSFQQPDLRHVAIAGQVIQVNNSGRGNSETHDTRQLKTLTSFLPLLAPRNPKASVLATIRADHGSLRRLRFEAPTRCITWGLQKQMIWACRIFATYFLYLYHISYI